MVSLMTSQSLDPGSGGCNLELVCVFVCVYLCVFLGMCVGACVSLFLCLFVCLSLCLFESVFGLLIRALRWAATKKEILITARVGDRNQ